jgi:hypothetical protein
MGRGDLWSVRCSTNSHSAEERPALPVFRFGNLSRRQTEVSSIRASGSSDTFDCPTPIFNIDWRHAPGSFSNSQETLEAVSQPSQGNEQAGQMKKGRVHGQLWRFSRICLCPAQPPPPARPAAGRARIAIDPGHLPHHSACMGRHTTNWGLLVTGGFIASLPPIVLSLMFYRYIVSGVAAGGLKG